MVVEFSGKFVHEIPQENFTVVLKKAKGEGEVPLFQTLTFGIEHVHEFHDEPVHHHGTGIENETKDPCAGELLENGSEVAGEPWSLTSLFEMDDFVEKAKQRRTA